MTEGFFKLMNQHLVDMQSRLLEEYSHDCSDEDFARIPITMMKQEEKDFIEKYGTVVHPIRDKKTYEFKENEKVYSLGYMPFRIKIKTNEQQ